GVVGCVLADDLDGILICAYGAVSAESVEHRAHDAVGLGREVGIVVQTAVTDIVANADGKVFFGLGKLEVVVDGFDHGRREFLGRQPVTSANNGSQSGSLAMLKPFMQGIDYVLVERLAHGSRFL